MPMTAKVTNARFAQAAARISAFAAAWAADTLDCQIYAPEDPARPDSVARFIREMRERLDDLEQELDGKL